MADSKSPEVVVFATACFEEWCARGFVILFFFHTHKKALSLPLVFFSHDMLSLSRGSVDRSIDTGFCRCYVEIVNVEGLCIWKSYIGTGSAAIFLWCG